jgi:hypothetical protein
MIHNHWLSITHHDTQPLAQNSMWLWIMVYYAEQVVMYYVVLCWASGCEPWCVILSQWLWIMVCYAEARLLNHGELWWANGCESWCVMLSQWLGIKVCYAEPVVVNHGMLFWASDCETCCVILSQWLWITMCYSEPVVENHGVFGSELHIMTHNHWFRITHHDSQPLAQHSKPWFKTTSSQ